MSLDTCQRIFRRRDAGERRTHLVIPVYSNTQTRVQIAVIPRPDVRERYRNGTNVVGMILARCQRVIRLIERGRPTRAVRQSSSRYCSARGATHSASPRTAPSSRHCRSAHLLYFGFEGTTHAQDPTPHRNNTLTARRTFGPSPILMISVKLRRRRSCSITRTMILRLVISTLTSLREKEGQKGA